MMLAQNWSSMPVIRGRRSSEPTAWSHSSVLLNSERHTSSHLPSSLTLVPFQVSLTSVSWATITSLLASVPRV